MAMLRSAAARETAISTVMDAIIKEINNQSNELNDQESYHLQSDDEAIRNKILALARELASLEPEFENAQEARVKAEQGPVAEC
jgi:hypothetical protein